MMFKAMMVAAAVAVASAAEMPRSGLDRYRKGFEQWLQDFSIEVEEQLYETRLVQWALNDDIIRKHNAGNHTWTLGHNEFSHLSWEEFKARQNMLFHPMVPKKTGVDGSTLMGATLVPNSMDWVEKGAVTAVKDQGSCGSCWSFSASAALEGAYAIKYGNMRNFSEQQMVDCDSVDQGCNGGLMDDAFAYVKKAGGMCTYEDYPYEGVEGSCRSSSCSFVEGSAPETWVDVAQSEDALMQAAALQPVAVAIQANQPSFQLYSGGVFTGRCGNRLDHGVTLVGYGTQDGEDYWKVKNSWGTSWGEDGYILISREGDLCGIQDAASYPILA